MPAPPHQELAQMSLNLQLAAVDIVVGAEMGLAAVQPRRQRLVLWTDHLDLKLRVDLPE